LVPVGDPTIFGNFNVDPSINDTIIEKIHTFKSNGYPPADGNKKEQVQRKPNKN
jgi:hypothetical protein